MNIVLDANVIVSEGYGSSGRFRLLVASAKVLGHRICVPAVAIDEVISKFAAEIAGEQRKMTRITAKLSRYLGLDLDPPLNGVIADVEAARLRDKLTGYDEVLRYPVTPHRELAMRAVNRKKPFDQSGSGYRDSLIWESVRELVSENSEQVALITNDRIFSNENNQLADELTDEIAQQGQGTTQVVLVPSVEEFINQYVRPALKEILDGDPVEAIIQLAMDPHETIALGIQEAYGSVEWTAGELNLPKEYESPQLSFVEDVSDLQRLDTRESSPGEYLLRVGATVDCDFDAFVFKPDAYGMDDLKVYDWHWNDHYAWVGISLQLTCELDLTISLTEADDPKLEVLSMSLV